MTLRYQRSVQVHYPVPVITLLLRRQLLLKQPAQPVLLRQQHIIRPIQSISFAHRCYCSSSVINSYGQYYRYRRYPRFSLIALGGLFIITTTASLDENQTRIKFNRTTLLEQNSIHPQQILEREDRRTDTKHVVSSDDDDYDDDTTATTSTTILNWSGTHSVQVLNENYWEPETIDEIEAIVQKCNQRGQPIRPIGSALSPNGIGFNKDGMMSMLQLDQIINVDTTEQTVTVQAGARVSQVIDALRVYQLTLPNLASIAEQQMGGFIQVGAHGTGMSIAPIDHYVTKLKLVTPGRGTITLTEQDGELFHMAKVGLGCLGIVVEITMKCIPSHYLQEHTFVLTRQQAKEQLDTLLQQHKHMRYMWIPYTDTVVCVTNDPIGSNIDRTNSTSKTTTHESSNLLSKFWNRKNENTSATTDTSKTFTNKLNMEERLQPMVDLLLELSTELSSSTSTAEPLYTKESVKQMNFASIRDALLTIGNPLDVNHVQRCNIAEAEFWKRNEDFIIKPSDELLQFDCGGQVR
jgi:L-galactono-1,4-lactone dehydrogenase